MTGILQQSRFWAWAGWLVAGALVIGFFAVMILSSGSYMAAGNAPLPPMLAATQLAEAPAAGGGEGDATLPQGPAVTIPQRLIIRTGSLSMEVADTRAVQAAIEGLVAEMAGEGAFVVSSNEFGASGDQLPVVNMAIRVPAARFDEVMDRVAAMALEVLSRSESGQDVTEEYVDLQARLESLEAARKRLLGIMESAGTTEELLMAEQQLTQREAELESIKGRMQYLQESAQLSSITIELRPSILNQPVEVGWRPAETVRRSLERQLERMEGSADFLINFVIVDLPWLAVFGLIVFGVVRLGQWWRRRAAKQKPPTEPGPKQSDG